MMQIFRTIDDKLTLLNEIIEGCWINLINPTEEEMTRVSENLNIDMDFIRAALDEEERSRIEADNGNTLIIVDIPMIVRQGEAAAVYNTLPLGIVLGGNCIITVCLKECPIIRDFIDNRVKLFYTFKKTRFILQILLKKSTYYLQYLKQIEKAIYRIENELHKSLRNKELIQLLELEKSLVFFSTSLKSNEIVMEKMLKLDYVKKYPEDTELLEDVIIENKQAIEMANIYSNILSGTMDAFASVISNNLNIVMKFLAAITIVMSIPTMIASFFGMNVIIPFAHHPWGFAIVVGIALSISSVAAILMVRRKMF